MAAKKKKTAAQQAKARKTKAVGTFALVVRVPSEAISYIDKAKGDRPRTAFLRDVLAKGDAGLGKILRAR